MDTNGPEAWYAGLPRITRAMITFTFIITVATTFQLIPQHSLLLNWQVIREKYHIHRILLSCLYAGPFSLKWVLHIYMFSQFSSLLEKNAVFANSVGSYLYFILLQIAMVTLISLAFYWPVGYPVLSDSILFAIVYYWSKRDMWNSVSIYFFTVKAYQLPFAMLFFNFIMGAPTLVHIIGLISGHAYYFLREVVPTKGYPNLLATTPRILDYIAKKLETMLTFHGSVSPSVHPMGPYIYHPASRQNAPSPGFMGRGIRLGTR
ncbi:Der1-like family protein [Babesia divergens]|uniref:Derlin n=1 Tax=Babesia divergens TaxID=32595 RepID=A0AAD9LDU4_BABDI|nr:Der1-like family protein [Babesia divergens]